MKLISCQKSRGEDLLFLGGAFTTYDYYGDFLSKLAKDFKIHFFNYPGLGGSQRLKRHSLAGYMGAVSSYTKKNNLQKFYLAGHSFGGYLATKYAKKRKNHIKSLILFSPQTRLQHKSYLENAKALIRTQILAEDKRSKTMQKIKDLHPFLNTSEKAKHAQFVVRQKLFKKDVPDDLPILVFLGIDDLVIDNTYSKKIFKKENVKIITLAKGGHLAHTFYPKKIVKEIKSFA